MKKLMKVFGRKSNPYFNHESYADPTAYYAIKSIEDDEKLRVLVKEIKNIVAASDFEIVGRIKFRNKRNGKVFK